MRLRITAKGIISVDNCVLLVRKPHGAWDLPGDRLNPGETPKVAHFRETPEEIGVDIEIGDLVHLVVRVKRCRPRFFVIYLCSSCVPLSDITLGEERVEARLFTTNVTTIPDRSTRYKRDCKTVAFPCAQTVRINRANEASNLLIPVTVRPTRALTRPIGSR